MKPPQKEDYKEIAEAFLKARRLGDHKRMRSCVVQWHELAYYPRNEFVSKLYPSLENQGFGGQVREHLFCFLSNATLYWRYISNDIQNTLLFSNILILEKDGDCYPGPFFPLLENF